LTVSIFEASASGKDCATSLMWDLGFRISGFGFRVQGSGFKVSGLSVSGFKIETCS
jgi:hypothetical protein